MDTRREFVKRAGLVGGAVVVGSALVAPAAQALMKPAFDPVLTLFNDGRSVAAGGPLNWGVGDEYAYIFATVKQGQVAASAAAGSVAGMAASPYPPSAKRWAATVTADRKFHAGPAQAEAIAVYFDGDEFQSYYWEMDISLR